MVTKINIPDERLDWARDIFQKNKQFFRFDEPRKYQDVIIGLIFDAINNGYKNIIVKARPGYGKSDVCMAICERFRDDRYYLLSSNLGLTSQYKDDFPKLREVKGRNNFECLIKYGFTANRGPCVYRKKFDCEKIDQCPYQIQKTRAQISDGVLSTPHYMCRVSRNAFPKRYIAIYDECHGLEQFFMRMIESYITEKEYIYMFDEPMPEYNNKDFWRERLVQMTIKCDDKLEVQEYLQDNEIEKLKNIRDRCNSAIKLLATKNRRCKLYFEKNDKGVLFVRFKPIKVNGLANSIIEDISDVRIFLTATLPSINTFIFNLGLDSSKSLYINVTKDLYPVENRWIYYTDVGYLTYKKKEKTLPLMVEDIVKVIDKHENDRGIILPVSHANRRYIVKKLNELGYEDRIVTHGSDKAEREEAIDRFMTELHEPLILVSTYITEGFNFPDITARFLYYMKVPFPSLVDEVVKERILLEQEEYREKTNCSYVEAKDGELCANYNCGLCKIWYFSQAATILEQGFGRIVRSPEDYGSLYIGDKSFKKFVNRWGFLLSNEFKRSIKWKNDMQLKK